MFVKNLLILFAVGTLFASPVNAEAAVESDADPAAEENRTCFFTSGITNRIVLDQRHLYFEVSYLRERFLVTFESHCESIGWIPRKYREVCTDNFPNFEEHVFLPRVTCAVASVQPIESEDAAEALAKSQRLANATEYAGRYAVAWSSGQAEQVSAFFADSGASYYLNGRKRSGGLKAIERRVQATMDEFQNLVISVVDVKELDSNDFEFHWRLSGTSSASGASIDLQGIERWTFNDKGELRRSVREFDKADYEQQLSVAD